MKTYEKVSPNLERSISFKEKAIVRIINLYDCMKCIARVPVFITLKDHIQTFGKIHHAN